MMRAGYMLKGEYVSDGSGRQHLGKGGGQRASSSKATETHTGMAQWAPFIYRNKVDFCRIPLPRLWTLAFRSVIFHTICNSLNYTNPLVVIFFVWYRIVAGCCSLRTDEGETWALLQTSRGSQCNLGQHNKQILGCQRQCRRSHLSFTNIRVPRGARRSHLSFLLFRAHHTTLRQADLGKAAREE